jgi:hypothetical protein
MSRTIFKKIQPRGNFGRQRILRGDGVVATADMRVAGSGRPARIPDGLRAILSPPELPSGTGQGAPLIL